MSIEHKGIVEGLLFASGDDGITVDQIRKVLGVTRETVEYLIEELKYDYEHVNRGMMIVQSNEVHHLTTKPEHNMYYKKLYDHKPRSSRMSQSILETLAIIAYRQPITRVEIEEIRGVNSNYAVESLLDRSLIQSVGRKEGMGRPILFGTSKEFLTYFGLTSLDELPALPNDIDSNSVKKEVDLFFRNAADER